MNKQTALIILLYYYCDMHSYLLDILTNDTRHINIFKFQILETLDISKNRLENIPDLSQLKSLKFLNASNNKITIMPLLPIHGKLDRIYFGENSLKEICMTSVLNSAESITEFLIQGNQLAECPNDIYLLRNLKVLDLSNNCLTNLPPSLGYMTFLQKILLEGNSIRTIKRTLLSSPVAEELKTFLRTRGPPPKSEKVNIENKYAYAYALLCSYIDLKNVL